MVTIFITIIYDKYIIHFSDWQYFVAMSRYARLDEALQLLVRDDPSVRVCFDSLLWIEFMC
jgi:hypothetical protein